jgi:hypothetical protein
MVMISVYDTCNNHSDDDHGGNSGDDENDDRFNPLLIPLGIEGSEIGNR